MPHEHLVRLQQTGGADHVHQQLVQARRLRRVYLVRSHAFT
jgi:hypothetical protein